MNGSGSREEHLEFVRVRSDPTVMPKPKPLTVPPVKPPDPAPKVESPVVPTPPVNSAVTTTSTGESSGSTAATTRAYGTASFDGRLGS